MTKRKLTGKWSSESGQASMVTVAMFMMLFAVIAVGFTYIVVTASRQAVNDSLSSSAKAAAESGVEDAKRLMVYCYANRVGDNVYATPEAQQLCEKVIGRRIEEPTCTEVLAAVSSSAVAGQFQLEDDGNGGHRVRVGGLGESGGDDNEYYQCLKIATKTPSYEDAVNGNGDSNIVHLKLVDASGNTVNPTRIEISWHYNQTGEMGDGPVKLTNTSGVGLPSAATWTSINRPAVLRVEQVGAKKSGISINNLVANDAAVTLRPSTGGVTSIGTNGGTSWMDTYRPAHSNQPNNQYDKIVSKSPIVETKCNSDPYATNYACKMIMYGTLDLVNYDYYLRLNAIYSGTHFKVQAFRGDSVLYFDGVQPIIDVTGKSGDAFSRIQAHVTPNYGNDDNTWWPEYAIDTDGKVCKDMNVYYDNGTDNCD